MTDIAGLQQRFQDFVVGGEADVKRAIVSDELASASERLAVYFDAYRLRLVGILETEFPGVRALTGDDQFRALGHDYLAQFPSTNPSVRWFAGHYADYLKKTQHPAATPQIAEMAAFEWARGLAFDARDVPALSPDRLAQLPADHWPSLRIDVHPSVRCVTFEFNTDELWRAVKNAATLPTVERRAEPATCCVWRRDLTLYWRLMHVDEARSLASFGSGHDFAQVCAELCDHVSESEVPAKAAGFLSRWFGEGLIVRIHD